MTFSQTGEDPIYQFGECFKVGALERPDHFLSQLKRKLMFMRRKPPEPVHIKGTKKGEECALEEGREHGRGGRGQYRSARDSTSINPEHHKPIHPAMPSIPPA
jgi:hypothetical protein